MDADDAVDILQELDEEDRWILKEMNIPETSVIRSLFTSGLKEQTEFVTRKDVGLPKDKFILIIKRSFYFITFL